MNEKLNSDSEWTMNIRQYQPLNMCMFSAQTARASSVIVVHWWLLLRKQQFSLFDWWYLITKNVLRLYFSQMVSCMHIISEYLQISILQH